MTQRDFAEKLLQKADQDLCVLDRLKAETGIAPEIVGFHGQQSAEKMLKAILALRGIKFPFTHQLAELKVADLVDSLECTGAGARPAKRGSLRDDEFVGMWRDREDLANSSGWVRELREREWK